MDTLPRGNFIGRYRHILFINGNMTSSMKSSDTHPHGHRAILFTKRLGSVVEQNKVSTRTNHGCSCTIAYTERMSLCIIHVPCPIGSTDDQSILTMSYYNCFPGL